MLSPETIEQLRQWMETHCYSDHHYAIGERIVHEGYGLRQSGGMYIWYYTERGSKDILKTFEVEKDAVAYAMQIIENDRFASSHLIGLVQNQAEEEALLHELATRNIDFWKDSIPYGGPNDRRTRVFVRGCDVLKVADLREKFGYQRSS
ncbi:hypothetical protein SAMN04487996_104387 [Dyadobacter soli]|uniref:Uncharacterized protein n=1 Tax=Dyadobacter soli TaxID=659014 RepID=A0A1G7C3A6_9BACT|nr:hypothetical protein [Dyadobacter soli]SDE33791.1 hypothetical protein SAMN04487996_104387 [Dyadobacter soli]